jgi:hypothetical protein
MRVAPYQQFEVAGFFFPVPAKRKNKMLVSRRRYMEFPCSARGDKNKEAAPMAN